MNRISYYNDLFLLVGLGTLCMMLIFSAIVIFVIKYQRRIIEKSIQIAKNNMDHQNQLLESAMHTKENEKKRLSRELHDAIGTEINALRLFIHNQEIAHDTKVKLNEECIKISKTVRRISEELLPVTLEKLGLQAALENFLDHIDRASKLEVQTIFESEQPFELSEQQSLSVFRVTQELINNILKHNNAQKLKFRFLHNFEKLQIIVEDDGFFFKPKIAMNQIHIGHGLLNIESRLQLISGKISYLENKPRGTFVMVTLFKECSEELELELPKTRKFFEED